MQGIYHPLISHMTTDPEMLQKHFWCFYDVYKMIHSIRGLGLAVSLMIQINPELKPQVNPWRSWLEDFTFNMSLSIINWGRLMFIGKTVYLSIYDGSKCDSFTCFTLKFHSRNTHDDSFIFLNGERCHIVEGSVSLLVFSTAITFYTFIFHSWCNSHLIVIIRSWDAS